MLPHDLAELALRRQTAVTSIWLRAGQLAGSLWSRLDIGDIVASWDRALSPTMQRILGAAQITAASGAQDYVSYALALQGIDPVAEATVTRHGFVGAAADGRSLADLLRQPAIAMVDAIGRGMPLEAANRRGLHALERIVCSEINDAGRVATGVATVVATNATRYVRALRFPSCSRCLLLGSRRYRDTEGFTRHLRCDCIHVPSHRDAGDLHLGLKEHFDTLSPAAQDVTFTRAGAQAIRDGADPARVVYARADMRSVAVAGRIRPGSGTQRALKPTPESIYESTQGNRDEMLGLLAKFGYIV